MCRVLRATFDVGRMEEYNLYPSGSYREGVARHQPFSGSVGPKVLRLSLKGRRRDYGTLPLPMLRS